MPRRALLALPLLLAMAAPAAAQPPSVPAAPQTRLAPDPPAIAFRLPEPIPWGPVTPNGIQRTVLAGDPARPCVYAETARRLPGHMSRPHDHFLTALSGTWWLGSGTAFNPKATVPVGVGSFVSHHDGAKAEPAATLIVGEGPGTSTPAAR